GALLGLDLDRALDRVQLHDAAAGAAGLVAAAAALARHALEELAVHLVLVLQAAHQPPAGTRDLLGAPWELLVPRHPDAHRPEALQPGRAARAVAAHAQRAEHPRLVARADVDELDARRRAVGELLGEHAQGRLALARVRDDEQRLVDRELEGDDLHVGVHLAGAGLEEPLEVLGLGLQLLVALQVVRLRLADVVARGALDLAHARADLRDLEPAPRRDDAGGADRRRRGRGLHVVDLGPVVETDPYALGHAAIVPERP